MTTRRPDSSAADSSRSAHAVDPERSPFGVPKTLASPSTTALPWPRAGFDPTVLVASLRAAGVAGVGCFESADLEVAENRQRTIVVARPWLRVTLGATRAVRLTPLADAVEPLLDLLRDDLNAVPASVPRGVSDRERLESADVFDALRVIVAAVGDRGSPPALPCGLFGAFSYDLVDQFEELPARRPAAFDDPDASLVLAGDFVVADHVARRIEITTRGFDWESARDVAERHRELVARVERSITAARPEDATEPCRPAAADADVPDAEFLRGVDRFRDAICAGEIFQGVLSRGLTMNSRAAPLDVYRALRQRNPSPYMFFLELADGELFGASPETCLRVDAGEVEIRPIAGTVPRGFADDGTIDDDLDSRLALGLLLDPKEIAEHAMLLDLARNDIARVAAPGTTKVVQQLAVEKFSHVQHLVSRVRGRLDRGLDALHAYRSAANMGTLSGAPKVRAMELIRAAEPHGRGFYGGAAGYLLRDGRFDSCIVIRSLRHRDGVYQTRAGAGVVWHSDPERELQETEHKSLACRVAVAAAELLGGH